MLKTRNSLSRQSFPVISKTQNSLYDIERSINGLSCINIQLSRHMEILRTLGEALLILSRASLKLTFIKVGYPLLLLKVHYPRLTFLLPFFVLLFFSLLHFFVLL